MRALLAAVLLLAGCAGPVPAVEAPVAPDGGVAADPVAVDGATPPAAEPEAPPAPDEAPPPGGFSSTHVFPGRYDASHVFSRVLERGPHAALAPEIVRLASDADGAAIELALLRPDVPPGTRVPVVVYASPYFVPMTPARVLGEDVPEGALPHLALHASFLLENFVPHGYAGGLVAVRGTGGSGGCMDLFGPLEQADLDQVVTWLGTQAWSNGKVAMIGLSYSASTPWEVAAKGNPHLATVVAASGLPDLGHYLYLNGTVHAASHGGFAATYWPFGFSYEDKAAPDLVAGAACKELVPAVVATTTTAFTLDDDALGWLAARDHRAGTLANWRGSVLLVQGLADWRVSPKNAYPFATDLEANGVVVKHLLGQWRHANPDSPSAGEHRRLDFAEILLHWFDRWLKDDPTVDLGPRAQVEDSEGTWRSEAAWPPPDATPVALHLAPGKLAATPGTLEAWIAPDAERVPSAAENVLANLGRPVTKPDLPCPACPTFAGDRLHRDLRIAGLPTLHVEVVPGGPGGHVAAHLYAVGKDGPRVIGRGAIDLRVADGGATPRPVTPGQAIVAKLQFEPMDAVAHAGEHLVLELHQGGYEERYGAFPTFPARVTGGALTLPTVVRGPEAFFRPPPLDDGP